jgi:hypothetical protein
MRLLFASVACLLPVAAFGQTAIGVGQSASQSSAVSVSSAQGGNVTFNNPASVTTSNFNRVRQSGSLRTTANAFAPQLTASAVNTCLGSTSFGIGVTGFGISGGSTHKDRECNLRMYSAMLLQLGQRDAAAAVLCHDPSVYNAFAAVGIRCPLVPDGYAVVGYPAGTQPYVLETPAVVRKGRIVRPAESPSYEVVPNGVVGRVHHRYIPVDGTIVPTTIRYERPTADDVAAPTGCQGGARYCGN